MTVASLERPAVAAAAPTRSTHQQPPAVAVGMTVEVMDFVFPRLEQARAIATLLISTIDNDQAPAKHFAELFSRCIELAHRRLNEVMAHEAVTHTSSISNPAYDWVGEGYELIALLTVMSEGLYSGGDSFDTEEVVVVNLLAAAQSSLESIMSAVGASRT